MTPLTKEEWMFSFSEMGALWVHDGNPRRPHALLTHGDHSSGFFNGSNVMGHPTVLRKACYQIVTENLLNLLVKGSYPDIVAGAANGSVTMASMIAELYDTRMIFTEPVMVDGKKEMQLNRFSVESGGRILMVDDTITTGDTVLESIAIFEALGAKVYPFVVVLVNRSGMKDLNGREIIALVDHPMPKWEANECPLCEQGSVAIRPKGNWDKLNAEY